MKLVIFGASGRTGRLLVEGALAKGHSVTGLVRDPSKLAVSDTRLRVAQGDIADPVCVEQVLSEQEAVLSALGPTRRSPPGILTTGAANIIAGMKKHGVSRLIWQTGAGLMDPEDEHSFIRTLMVNLMHLLAPDVLRDSEQAFARVRASGLDWTIVRVPRLGDGPARGDFQISRVPPGPKPVARADVAAFMLQQLADHSFSRRAPMIGYR